MSATAKNSSTNGRLDWFDRLGVFTFFSSLPILLPSLDSLNWMLTMQKNSEPMMIGETISLIWTMPIAAMFTALAVLFVCLFKTGYIALGKTHIRIGGVAFIGAYFVLIISAFVPSLPDLVLTIAGLPLGFGAATLCLCWAMRVNFQDLRIVFRILIMVLLVAAVLNAILTLLPPLVGMAISLVLACVGSAAAMRISGRRYFELESPNLTDSNWWDVFGKFDLSLVDGGDNFQSFLKSPTARILFFVVTPINVLLLFVMNRNIAPDPGGTFSFVLLGCLLASICAIPLLFMRSDYGMINAGLRLFLPLLAFCVFIANTIVLGEGYNTILHVGINVFCTLYTLLTATMIIAVAARMRSLVLPAGSLLIIILSLATMLSYMQMHAGVLEAFQRQALIVLFVLAVVMLLITSGSHMWKMMQGGVVSSDKAMSPTQLLQERCNALASSHKLTTRESEILYFLGQGYSAAYVADVLYVAESTVRSHRKNIYSKLNLQSREQLIELLNREDD